MKVVILAGGFGTRIADVDSTIPKPMVPIGGLPILWHIMNRYAKFGFKDFYLALGYKAEVVKEYFWNYRILGSNFTIDLASGAIERIDTPAVDWRVTLVDTGLSTMTGGRLRRLAPYLNGEPFLLTYGDGVADVDLNHLLAHHRKSAKEVTVTAVRPAARFGELSSMVRGSRNSAKSRMSIPAGSMAGSSFVKAASSIASPVMRRFWKRNRSKPRPAPESLMPTAMTAFGSAWTPSGTRTISKRSGLRVRRPGSDGDGGHDA